MSFGRRAPSRRSASRSGPSPSLGTPDHVRAGRGEDLERARVGRGVGEDDVARVEERAGDQVEPLLAAGRDQHVGRGRAAPRAARGRRRSAPGARRSPPSARSRARGSRPRAARGPRSARKSSVGSSSGGGCMRVRSTTSLGAALRRRRRKRRSRLGARRAREERAPRQSGRARGGPGPRLGSARGGDEAPAADHRGQEARRLELGVGAHDGVAVGPERRRERARRRQPEAVREHPAPDAGRRSGRRFCGRLGRPHRAPHAGRRSGSSIWRLRARCGPMISSQQWTSASLWPIK